MSVVVELTDDEARAVLLGDPCGTVWGEHLRSARNKVHAALVGKVRPANIEVIVYVNELKHIEKLADDVLDVLRKRGVIAA